MFKRIPEYYKVNTYVPTNLIRVYNFGIVIVKLLHLI